MLCGETPHLLTVDDMQTTTEPCLETQIMRAERRDNLALPYR